MDRIVRIGAATAFFNDSRMGIEQLLEKANKLDYIIFDFLAESVLGGLGRAVANGSAPGFATDFVAEYIGPHLRTLLERGVRVVANAGGLNPTGCSQLLRKEAEALGLRPRIGVVQGDNLTARLSEFVDQTTYDMFDQSSVARQIENADRVNSLVAYTGAFPIAAALAAGADIVITGRAVDSALTLGALIHEFGWGPDDFDVLAAGTLAGHLLECTAQVTGGTFTDWRDVPDWAGIGMPVGECAPSGQLVITKPEGTGGLVSIGTVAEQLLYEVSDPQRYIVPDVIADFTQVTLRQVGTNRVEVTGARGSGRTATFKASLTYDAGWRATALLPVIGLEAEAKARRVGEEIFHRTSALLRKAQLPPFTTQRCDIIGGRNGDSGPVICRLLVDHLDRVGAEWLVREQASAISHMSVGISLGLGSSVRPVQRIASFLIPKSAVSLHVTLDSANVAFSPAIEARDDRIDTAAATLPATPDDANSNETVPLIRLAWARSGDKGNLFNVAVIARQPRFLPYIAAALTPEKVGVHYGHLLADGRPLPVERFFAPGVFALNFVVGNSMEGGVLACTTLDPVAKGMAQLLLSWPIPVTAEMRRQLSEAANRCAQGSGEI
jgi:Acyclic terpene utilisation family protein AtuA